MKSAITKFFSIFVLASYVSFCTYVGIASAVDTASILPPAKTTYFDQNGKPLTAGTVDYYIPGTTTRKTTWQDAAETIPNTNPVVLDAAGRSLVLGSGSYRQVVKDKNGNLIWDQVTSSVGSGGGGGTSVGDGLLVGSTMPWAGFIAPPNWAFAYGQEVARTTYPELLAAITSVQAVFCTSGSPTLSGLSDTTQLPIGAKIEVSCLAAGATIVSKTSSTITASVNAVTSVNTNATFYPWGNGNGTTTFNIPDLRGVTLAGRPNMGGTNKANLSTTYFGINPLGLGPSGGTESKTLITANLPPYTPAGTNAAHSHTMSTNSGDAQSAGAGGSTHGFNSSVAASVILQGGSNTFGTTNNATDIFTGTAQGGTSTPISVIQPTTITNYIIKVTPDISTVIASGVSSLGGMTGVIACGSGLTCASNTISVITPGVTSLNSLTGGLNIVAGSNVTVTPAGTSITIASTGGSPGGSDTQVQYNNAGSFGGVTGATSNGTTLTLVAPVLGTPASATLTNATGLPISTGVSGLAANVATWLGASSSANLAAALTDETGTGFAVFSASPTFTGTVTMSAATLSGVLTTNVTGGGTQCVQVSNAGAISGTGSACSSGGTPGGSNTQVQFNNSGAFGGSANFTWVSPKLTLGTTGTTGQLGIAGTTSGNVTQTVQATAGTPTITWGNTSGTPAVTASAPLALATTTGNLTITGAAGQILAGATPAFTATPTLGASGTIGTLAFGNATSGTVTLGTVTGALGSVTMSLPAATDTIVGKATTDTFTNKTYDTAGTGNSFSINSVAVTANTGTGAVARATSPSFTTPAIGAATGSSATLTGAAPQVVLGANATTLGSVKMFGNTSGDVTLSPAAVAGTSTALTLPATSGTLTLNIASGTSAMGTSAISSASCATVVTTSATGTATTDVVLASFNGDPTAVTGYVPLTSGMLTIIAYPTANNVNFKVCNNTSSSITPGAITLNWKVVR